VTYSIIRGDNREQFEVDPDTGYISVADELDRETTSSYVLEVLAKDNGVPVLSRQTLVNIEISDANDNPPLFAQPNYTTIIQVGVTPPSVTLDTNLFCRRTNRSVTPSSNSQ
jgi:protocadherin Fat 1/2/3